MFFWNSLSGTPWAGRLCFFCFFWNSQGFFGIPCLGPLGLANYVFFVFFGIHEVFLEFRVWDPLGRPIMFFLFFFEFTTFFWISVSGTSWAGRLCFFFFFWNSLVFFGIPFLGPLGLDLYFGIPFIFPLKSLITHRGDSSPEPEYMVSKFPLKGNIGGYFKAILKANLGIFWLFWSISWLPLLSGPVKQRPLRAP